MWEHVQLTVVAAIIVVLIAVPLGIMLTRPAFRLAVPFVIAIANAGQAAPSVGLILLLFPWLAGGFWTDIWAPRLYGLVPVLRHHTLGARKCEVWGKGGCGWL